MAGKEVVVAKYRRSHGFVVLLYLCLLIIPWLLTCIQSSSPFRLTVPLSHRIYKYDVDELGIQPWDATWATNWTYALEVLTVFAAVVALPVIYMLLSRAAVVFTLRTRATKKVSARQLFSLADGRYLQHGLRPDSEATWLTRFGAGLILIALAQFVLRAALVHTVWSRHRQAYPLESGGIPSTYNYGQRTDEQQIGPSPGLAIISDLNRSNIVRQTLHSIIVGKRSQGSSATWYDDRDERYFVTALPSNTNTGLFRQVALRMDSNARCETIGEDEFPTPCPGTGFPYVRKWSMGEEFGINTATVDVCVFTNPPPTAAGADYTSPWSADTNDTQYLEEEMYISAKYPYSWQSLSVRCVGNTTLGYFELGNFHNGGNFSQTIKSYSEYAQNNTIMSRSKRGWYDSYDNDVDPDAELDHVKRATPGPLTIAALALFGSGSFYDLAAWVGNNSIMNDPLTQALAVSCPFPFKTQLPTLYQYPCDIEYYDDAQSFPASAVHSLISLFNPDRTKTNHLEVAMYLANQALMDMAVSVSQKRSSRADYIWTTEGLQYRQFVMSTTAMVVVSVLVALQALGMIALLVYSYRVRTWTSTLDALAIARIAHQLKDGDFIRWIGLREVSRKQRKQLGEVNGLIGIVERPPDSALPPGQLDDSSSAEDTAAATARSSTAGRPSVTQAEQDQTTGRNSFGQGEIPQPPPESPAANDASAPPLHPRMSLNIGDNEYEMDDLEAGRQSPPAYTPRHTGRGTDPMHAVGLEPPNYTTVLAINELCVGAQGIVTGGSFPHSRPGLAAPGDNV
ncbi:hypothetical protein B0H66DRAFT_546641 [Apodospora peruviana]|uniref:Uncharacterized protein n=1 Tax=Apodospora peruviana TaxID=516989 RepID=A0AAE0MGA2_9PEZI|nr:hypothetical protein B0H66DRAFT_546641 [Apodospora peruviana]